MEDGDEESEKVKKSYRDIKETVGGGWQNDEMTVYLEGTVLKSRLIEPTEISEEKENPQAQGWLCAPLSLSFTTKMTTNTSSMVNAFSCLGCHMKEIFVCIQ